jgi:hypothetical protein
VKRRLQCAAVFVVSTTAIVVAQRQAEPPLDDWQKAAQRVERLSPNRFQQIPATIRQLMLADGCRIPQYGTPRPDNSHEPPRPLTNLTSGEFAARGQHDWAALCSLQGRSTIHVYWGGPSTCVPDFKAHEDVQLLEDYSFAYLLIRVTIPQMRAQAQSSAESGEPLPLPPLTHDGLALRGKAAEFYYCDHGKWSTFMPTIP